MKKDFRINPVGLKGNEINERMKQLMGITPINENVSRSVVELTKMGPDGKAYAIVRENHEYYIKVSDKTSNLVTEDFKYIGGLQNKKKEAYPSYAKATKHLNLSFKSLAEAYGTDSNINVFEDDDLLNEENFATKHVVDKAGHELKQDAKEGSEEDGFGDNLANGKVKNDIEKPKKIDEGWAGFAEMSGNGFMEEGMFGDDLEMTEEEKYIDNMLEFDKPAMDSFKDQYGDDKGESIYYATANKQGRNPETFEKTDEGYMEEELYGNQGKLDMNHNGEVDGDDLSMLRNMDENWMEEDMYEEDDMGMEPSVKPTLSTAKSQDEWFQALDDASAKEILLSLYHELGKPVVNIAKKVAGAIGGQDVRDALNNRHGMEEEFPDLNGDGETTYADVLKGRGVDLDEALTLEEIKESIAELKKKL